MTRIVRVGKNLLVSIPVEFARQLHVKPKDYLSVRLKEDEMLLIYEKVELE